MKMSSPLLKWGRYQCLPGPLKEKCTSSFSTDKQYPGDEVHRRRQDWTETSQSVRLRRKSGLYRSEIYTQSCMYTEDEPLTHHRLCSTYLKCTPKGPPDLNSIRFSEICLRNSTGEGLDRQLMDFTVLHVV